MRIPLPRAMRGRRPLQPLVALLQPGRATSPLGVALLAAIALHLLALSALQLRQRRQPAAAIPPPRDDTPELLRFSRQQTREPAIAPLSISSLAQLPPPPPPGPGGRQTAATSGAAGQAARNSDLGRTPPPRGRGSRSGVRATAPGSPASSRPASDPGRLDPGLKAALTALTRWQAAGEGQAAIAAPAGWPAPQKPETEQLALWKRLWEAATPAAAGAALPEGLELRRLAAEESAAAPLPQGGRLRLELGDRLLMIWWSAGELRLLQAPAGRTETEGDGLGS